MAQSGSPENEVESRSLLKAKWFPAAIATLALGISLGGHAFTALNSIGYAKLANKVDSLLAFQYVTEKSDSGNDKLIMALKTELANHSRVIADLRSQVQLLKEVSSSSVKSEPSRDTSGREAVLAKANEDGKKAHAEKRPLASGVNERFDSLVRSRMKPYWVEPTTAIAGERAEDDDVVVLQFTIERSGMIVDVQVANSSGQMEFDNNAVKAALKMDSIPEIARVNDETFKRIQTFRLAISPAQMR